MKKHLKQFITLFILMLFIGGGVALYQIYLKEIHFKVAVESIESDEAKALNAISLWMAQEKRRYRFKVTAYHSKAGVYQAVNEKKAQFAVFRADEFQPRTMASITTLFQEKAVFVLPKGSPIKEWKQFSNKTVGVVGRSSKDDMLLFNQLRLNGATNVKLISLTNDEANTQLKQRKIQAIAFVSPLLVGSEQPIKLQSELTFLEIEDAETLAARDKRYGESAINASSITSKLPAETVATLEVQRHLYVLKGFPNRLISALLNDIYDAKRALLGENPFISQINAPNIENGAHVKIHGGAITYYNDEVITLTQFFTDNFYTIPMFIGAFGTLFVWFAHILAPKNYFNANELLLENIKINEDLRQIKEREALVTLKKNHDEVMADLIKNIENNQCKPETAIPLLEAVNITAKKIEKKIRLLKTL